MPSPGYSNLSQLRVGSPIQPSVCWTIALGCVASASWDMAERWDEVVDTVGGLLPSGAAVVVDGGGPVGLFADRLVAALESAGRRCVRPDDEGVTKVGEVTLAAGGRWRAHPPAGRWDVVVW